MEEIKLKRKKDLELSKELMKANIKIMIKEKKLNDIYEYLMCLKRNDFDDGNYKHMSIYNDLLKIIEEEEEI